MQKDESSREEEPSGFSLWLSVICIADLKCCIFSVSYDHYKQNMSPPSGATKLSITNTEG